jgi:prophage regulatory protein
LRVVVSHLGEISMAIWRIQACKGHSGHRSTATIYNYINAGLWTKPVRIGQRSVGWPSDEVEAITKARIAGATDDQLRELVTRLHAKREGMLKEVLHG